MLFNILHHIHYLSKPLLDDSPFAPRFIYQKIKTQLKSAGRKTSNFKEKFLCLNTFIEDLYIISNFRE